MKTTVNVVCCIVRSCWVHILLLRRQVLNIGVVILSKSTLRLELVALLEQLGVIMMTTSKYESEFRSTLDYLNQCFPVKCLVRKIRTIPLLLVWAEIKFSDFSQKGSTDM